MCSQISVARRAQQEEAAEEDRFRRVLLSKLISPACVSIRFARPKTIQMQQNMQVPWVIKKKKNSEKEDGITKR